MLKRSCPWLKSISFVLLACFCLKTNAQEMTLEEAVRLARSSSVQALEARQTFLSVYWAWRAYQAGRMPSLTLYGGLANFTRSLSLLQNPDDGSMKYVGTFNMQNELGIRVTQIIPWTGGTLSVFSDLNRIDQFGTNKKTTWFARPLSFSYNQPLFSFNQFKWDKRIEPKEYERGKRIYLETLEYLSQQVTDAFFGLLSAQLEQKTAIANLADMQQLVYIASERVTLGTVPREEYLQLRLRMLNDSLFVHESALRAQEAQMEIQSLLGFENTSEIQPVLNEHLPSIFLDPDQVLEDAFTNSEFNINNQIELLNATAAIEKAKADRGISVSFNARLGLSKSGDILPDAYLNPLDQEVLGISFSVPIFDWGQGKGKIQKAKAAEEVVKAQVIQRENDFKRRLFMEVGLFNNQYALCSVSKKAMEIAEERYKLIVENFKNSSVSVWELGNARNERDSAQRQYLADLGLFWKYYYIIRKETLYDYLLGKALDIDVKELTNSL